jgi:cytochrome c
MKTIKMALLGLLMAAGPALAGGHASGDATAGEKVFKKCKACHAIVADDGTAIVKGGRNAPNLYGIYDRQAGVHPDFKKYGKSLVAAGAQGLVWNEADFVVYVADPKKFLKTYLDDKKAKSKMAYKLKNTDDQANVWAYLVSVAE